MWIDFIFRGRQFFSAKSIRHIQKSTISIMVLPMSKYKQFLLHGPLYTKQIYFHTGKHSQVLMNQDIPESLKGKSSHSLGN